MNTEQPLDRLIKQLPRNGTPSRDLWPGIEHAIEANDCQRNSQPRRAPRLLAIAAMVVVAVLYELTHYTYNPGGGASQTLNGDALVAVLSQQHEAQLTSLLAAVHDTPAVTSDWTQQLDELHDAAQAIKAALANDPDNRTLLRMLQNVYQQQLTLVERVHAPQWQRI